MAKKIKKTQPNNIQIDVSSPKARLNALKKEYGIILKLDVVKNKQEIIEFLNKLCDFAFDPNVSIELANEAGEILRETRTRVHDYLSFRIAEQKRIDNKTIKKTNSDFIR